MEYKEEYGWLTNICLNVTDACNLACRYCFVEQNPHYMSLETAKKAVHFVLDNLEKKNKKFGTEEKGNIVYFGGEPTLMWDEIIVPLTNYIRENNFPITLNMTSNGTLLDENKLQFLSKNKISLLLSMDGGEKTQNYNRPCRNSQLNSFDMLSKNIPYILQYYPNITFRATIYADTVEETFKNFLFAHVSGFKNVYFLPDSRHKNWTKEKQIALEKELNKIYAFLGTYYINGQEPPINFKLINRSFKNILKNDIRFVKNQGYKERTPQSYNINRCGLGITLGSIGYDGSIYGCQEQDSKGEKSRFYLGNIYKNNIEEKLHKELLEEYAQPTLKTCERPERCEKCLSKFICHESTCPSTSYDLFEDFFITPEIHCIFYEKLMNNSLILLERMVKENNLIFKNYLMKSCGYDKILNLKEKGEENG